MSAISALIRPDRYPLSSQYDPRWVIALEMGPHPLWQLEDILPAGRRTARLALRVCPFPAHQLPMPAKQRRRRHDESMPAPVRKQPSKRRDQGTIGRPQLRTLMLASQDRQLMAQQHEFAVFSELGPSSSNEQPQTAEKAR